MLATYQNACRWWSQASVLLTGTGGRSWADLCSCAFATATDAACNVWNCSSANTDSPRNAEDSDSAIAGETGYVHAFDLASQRAPGTDLHLSLCSYRVRHTMRPFSTVNLASTRVRSCFCGFPASCFTSRTTSVDIWLKGNHSVTSSMFDIARRTDSASVGSSRPLWYTCTSLAQSGPYPTSMEAGFVMARPHRMHHCDAMTAARPLNWIARSVTSNTSPSSTRLYMLFRFFYLARYFYF